MSPSVIVLGIHDGHNAGVALLKDGKIAAAIQEERLNNIKNWSGPPIASMRKVFEIAGIHPSDLTLIAISGLLRTHAPIAERPLHVRAYEKFAFLFRGHRASRWLVNYLHKFRKFEQIERVLLDLGVRDIKISFIEHHIAHAASAFHTRPWDDDSLILTLDGAGDGLCSSVAISAGHDMRRIASSTAYNSPANVLYSEVTGFLGMKRWEHEYKIMGLAPYGNADSCLDEIRTIVRVNPRAPLEFENTSGRYLIQVQGKLRKMLAEQRFDNIAAATQRHFEDIVCQWVKAAIDHTGRKKVVCAGGAFLNVKANKLIREMPDVDDCYFYPAASDEGTAVGAAFEAYRGFCEREGLRVDRDRMPPLYLGESFDEEHVRATIKKAGLLDQMERVGDPSETMARLLSKGKIVARFSGRGEWGPRALGNRSILADPRNPGTPRRLNFAIKMRDFWMPFAPSISLERSIEYLKDSRFAPYMIEAFDTTDRADDIIAGLHPFDRTARPQIVNDWNPGFLSLLREFDGMTGVGGVVNTSFNLHGYPIVGSPDDAIRTFKSSALDALFFDDLVISR